MTKLRTGIMVALIGGVFLLSPTGNEIEQNLGLAFLYKLRGTISPPTQVTMVYFDGNTAAQLDLPDDIRLWPRSVHACILKRLNTYGAAIIVFDIAFLKPRPELIHTTDICHEIPDGMGGDEAFIETIRESGNVILLEQNDQGRYRIDGKSLSVTRTINPLAEFSEAAMATAPFLLPKTPLRLDYFWPYLCGTSKKTEDVCNRYVATLPTAAAQSYKSADKRDGYDIPDDNSATLKNSDSSYQFLNFYGPPRTIPCRSYQSILRTELNDEPCAEVDFSGSIVFIGVAEYDKSDQVDSFHTVFSRSDGIDLAGVEILATATANLLNDESLNYLHGFSNLLIIILFSSFLAYLFSIFSPLSAIFACLIVCLAYIGLAHIAFTSHYVVLPIAAPLLVQLPLIILIGSVVHFQLLKKVSGYFVPERALQRLLKQDESQSSDLVYGFCLATDMVDSTGASERLGPEKYKELEDKVFETTAGIIKKQHRNASLDYSDGVMAAWEISPGDKDPYSEACITAMDILDALEKLNGKLEHPVKTRIGLHVGEFTLGNVGGGESYVYKASGDTVITAKRLEQENKKLGTYLLASGAVVENTRDILLRHCGLIRLKGKSEPIRITEILARYETADDDDIWLCESFESALEIYDKKHWREAVGAFNKLKQQFPTDGPTKYYLSKASQFAQSSTALANTIT